MIYFHAFLIGYLKSGFNDRAGRELVLQGTLPAPGMTIQEMSKRQAKAEKSEYMCGWAFELLRNHEVCFGVDFRRFHQRFATALGRFSPRCLVGERKSCKGDMPANCPRFRGIEIENQSAHDDGCSGACQKLIWNEASYRSI